MDWSTIGLRALEFLSPLLLTALTWLMAKAAQLIAAHLKNAYLRGVLLRLDDAILVSIKEVSQTTVDAIKAGSADGTLSDADKARVKQAALDSVKSHLGMKGLLELAKILGLDDGALEKVLSTRIEAGVHDLKLARAKATATAGVPVAMGAPLPLPAS